MITITGTPEMDKLSALREEREAAARFIDHVEATSEGDDGEGKFTICVTRGSPCPCCGSREHRASDADLGRLVAGFLGIDYDALERERRTVLEQMAAWNKVTDAANRRIDEAYQRAMTRLDSLEEDIKRRWPGGWRNNGGLNTGEGSRC